MDKKPFELIMALLEEIKLEKKNKAGNQRTRNRLSRIKGLITEAKRQLVEEDKSI